MTPILQVTCATSSKPKAFAQETCATLQSQICAVFGTLQFDKPRGLLQCQTVGARSWCGRLKARILHCHMPPAVPMMMSMSRPRFLNLEAENS